MTLRGWLVAYLVLLHLLVGALALALLRDQRPWLVPVEVALVLSLGAGVFLASRVFAGLGMVREAQQLLDDGDFMSRVREVGQPEVDRLIRLFNRMSDRLRDERVQLQEQHHFLSRILAVSPVGALFLDFDGRAVYANPAAERLLELAADRLLGRRLPEIEGPLVEALAALPVNESTVVPLYGGRRVRCHHGSFLDRGFPRGYLLLEELTEELRQFEKAAYGKLIRTMSHEVNNSMGASNSLLHSCLNYASHLPLEDRADFTSALTIAIARTEQLNRFMRSFADVIRLPPPLKAPCAVRDVLAGVERLVRVQCEGQGIAWHWAGGPDPGAVLMDRAQMEQVFLNVVKNAIEAIGEGGAITVRFERRDGRPAVVVQDSGPGLTAEARQNLFTPFFSTKEHGQGIGLTVVQEILTQHRFQFSLDSPPGGPTQFTVVF